MANDAYRLALQDTLDGMTYSFPFIRNALIFSESGRIIAVHDKTCREEAVRAVDALDEMLNKASLLDNLENAVFEGAKGWLNISRFNDLFLVTVVSSMADVDRARACASVILPTVIKVLRRVNLIPAKENLEELEVEHEQSIARDSKEEDDETVQKTKIDEHTNKSAEGIESTPVLPEPQVNQFIVENLGGLFVSSDTVRIDEELLSKWKEMYPDMKVEEVEIATFGGKSVRCKVKPIKDKKFEGKGLVQIHEKVQSTLEIKKGELVKVKPVIE